MWKIGPAVPRTTSEDGVVHTSETSGGQPDSTIADQHNGSAIDQEFFAGNPDIRYNIISDAIERTPPAIQNIIANALTGKPCYPALSYTPRLHLNEGRTGWPKLLFMSEPMLIVGRIEICFAKWHCDACMQRKDDGRIQAVCPPKH